MGSALPSGSWAKLTGTSQRLERAVLSERESLHLEVMQRTKVLSRPRLAASGVGCVG